MVYSMLTNHHEVGHTLFDDDPSLISRALRHAGLDFPELVQIEQLSTDLGTVEPVERRADRVLRIETTDGRQAMVVVEVQRKLDPDKPKARAYYGMTLVNRYALPVVIVVIATTARCERWADRSFDFGLGMGDTLAIRPLVLGPSTVRVITDVAEAEADLVYAALSIIVHRDGPHIDAMLEAVVPALANAPDPERTVLADHIDLILAPTAKIELWRKLMTTTNSYVFQGPTFRGMIDKATAEGKAEFLLEAIELRGIDLTAEQSERVSVCTDQELLRTWLSRVFDAKAAGDIFRD
jgi:hypothetical protein